MFKDKDIIITGGAGFIGSNMTELLLRYNRVTVLDNLSNVDERYISVFRKNRNFRFVKSDLAEKGAMDRLDKSDIVIHLAANSDVRGGSSSPETDFKNNVLATFNLLEWMRKTGTGEILFASSSTVYGETKVLPTPENFGPYMPISSYGASKMSGEGFITAYSHYYGIRGTIFRFANIVGRNSTHGVIFDFIKKLRSNRDKLEILGDGSQRKSYLHVTDCISSMVHVHENSRTTDIYNLGNPGTTSVRKIADIIVDKMHLGKVEYRFTGGIDGRGWKGDVKVAQLAIDKLSSTGWKNRYSSDEAVELAVDETLAQNP
ncbi:MAG: UDP-glucose 4-epimerase [Thermoplasmatales archaeon B_DKE]|nr:MAG: UDP-glucose 4-epimerase [Thermoplasmatales archaeon B_DKE]